MRAGQLRRELAPGDLTANDLEQIYLEEMSA